VELHPGTLEYVAEVGHIDSWGGASMGGDTVLPFLFSSAHPVVDPERHGLWTTKLEPVSEPTFGMRPSVVWWDRNGTEVKWWPLEGISFPGSTHTVSQTRDWVILCDSGNFKADAGEMFGGERTVTIDAEVPVWLIRKDDLFSRPSARRSSRSASGCRRPTGTSTPATTTATACRSCGRAWTSWTWPCTCAPTTSTSTATR
jgi:hypothetical protein